MSNRTARRTFRAAMLASSALLAATATTAYAQEEQEITEVEEIIVVGSQIRGAKTTAALPVTMVSEDDIIAAAPASGDDLFRSIPQMGDVTFNASYVPNSSNSARGDTGSVNLRSLGIGNTLVLLNGRRVVGHPTSQANEHLVPVLTYNTNAIPVSGLKRLEVLRDGAAAIYGADAVAGVVNTVLRDDMNSWTMSVQHGGAEGTGMRETNLSVYGGKDIMDGRGNLSAFFNYDHRSELNTLDQGLTASNDFTSRFAGTDFANIASLNGTSNLSPWGRFTVRGTGRTDDNSFTTFTVTPVGTDKCVEEINGVCLITGTTLPGHLNADAAAMGLTVMPEVDRFNLFTTGRFEINDNIEAFAELGGYYAKSLAFQEPIASASAVSFIIPGTNYYNPFNNNPDITVTGYRYSDFGPIRVEVVNKQFRTLAGLRGDWNGWNWETALVHSEASAKDVSDNISATKLQEWAGKNTADAYNFFNGGDATNPRVGDTTLSNQAAIDGSRVDMVRYTKTELSLVDFKISRPDIYELPAGSVGIAAGLEFRKETQLDDRDSRIDGTITYTNLAGVESADLINQNLNPDTYGERDVFSAYVELAAPLVSPDMAIPFVHNLEVQLAGRFEEYSDFGSIAKPKIAAALDIVDGFRIRGSWAQGFRAPNLEQINATLVTRSNQAVDWHYCEALLNRGAINNMGVCGGSTLRVANDFVDASAFKSSRYRKSTPEQRTGNPDLQPEESETVSLGLVIQPRFIPAEYGDFTITADWWQVEQTGMVGLFIGQNAVTLDYIMRKNGSYNPNVVRAEATADDIRLYAGSGLEAIGEIQYITDTYGNQQPQTVEGLDLGVNWRLRGTEYGDFNVNLNVSHLLKYYIEYAGARKELADSKAAGDLNSAIWIAGSYGNMIADMGRPEWKWSMSATWRKDAWTVGAFTQYISELNDKSLLNGAGDMWVVDDSITGNLYGEYEFSYDQFDGRLAGTAIRVGVRNITDEAPPIARGGYVGTVYQPYGRYWYASVRKAF